MFYGTQKSYNGFLRNIPITLSWLLPLGFFYHHFLHNLKNLLEHQDKLYSPIYREVWAVSVCWIVFACHSLKSGWILRDFLSKPFWQPLSKLTLCSYLTHCIYMYLTNTNKPDDLRPTLWWEMHTHIADLVVFFFVGGIFYLTIEAPAVKIVQILWCQMSSVKQIYKLCIKNLRKIK